MNKKLFSSIFELSSYITGTFLSAYGVWFTVVLFFSALDLNSPAEVIQAIGSLFAACAVIITLASVFLQQKNFTKQLFELRDSSFSKTFSQLLDIHNNALSLVEYNNKHGANCFPDMTKGFRESQSWADFFRVQESDAAVEKSYKWNVKPSYSVLFSYFNTTSLIFDFIDKEASSNKAKLYVDMFTSKMTEPELVLLMFHAIFEDKTGHLKSIANKYSIFRAVRRESGTEIIQKHYLPSAFGLNQWATPQS